MYENQERSENEERSDFTTVVGCTKIRSDETTRAIANYYYFPILIHTVVWCVKMRSDLILLQPLDVWKSGAIWPPEPMKIKSHHYYTHLTTWADENKKSSLLHSFDVWKSGAIWWPEPMKIKSQYYSHVMYENQERWDYPSHWILPLFFFLSYFDETTRAIEYYQYVPKPLKTSTIFLQITTISQ